MFSIGRTGWEDQRMSTTSLTELLLISGRSGVGKSTVAAELHHLLAQADVKHALIEGDNLDLAHPAPWEHGLAEKNLRAMWQNYRDLGYRRLIYVNTVSALFEVKLTEALGERVGVISILLTADDESIRHRLRQREVGSALDLHMQRSRDRAHELHVRSPASVRRIPTDAKSVTLIAREILDLVGWTPDPSV
jgi:ABC-type dipeptide/oligopeptide/nickel transport system ATPase subunit